MFAKGILESSYQCGLISSLSDGSPENLCVKNTCTSYFYNTCSSWGHLSFHIINHFITYQHIFAFLERE
ncbi:hypothetical protein PsorP6_014609 [Peronosclerospora sorghi]|uniref:Uncharacterized protein n=1 Tax=Peronosclerospora sorghi TaxID=230839 RepID=A0ACC0VS14_9STRA|nr:hypothetical protein PsorP6_014609 [Peronosclerospora sorghi]